MQGKKIQNESLRDLSVKCLIPNSTIIMSSTILLHQATQLPPATMTAWQYLQMLSA